MKNIKFVAWQKENQIEQLVVLITQLSVRIYYLMVDLPKSKPIKFVATF